MVFCRQGRVCGGGDGGSAHLLPPLHQLPGQLHVRLSGGTRSRRRRQNLHRQVQTQPPPQQLHRSVCSRDRHSWKDTRTSEEEKQEDCFRLQASPREVSIGTPGGKLENQRVLPLVITCRNLPTRHCEDFHFRSSRMKNMVHAVKDLVLTSACLSSCPSDVDECRSHNGGCDHVCRNSHGSYSCHCRDGYRLAQNKHACVGEQTFEIQTTLMYVSFRDER